jgi:transposase
LFEEQGADGTVAVNARCLLRTRDGHRLVLVAGVTLAHYAVGDRMAEAYAAVSLVEQGWASQVEVARAFGWTTRTIRRLQHRFEGGGLAALGRQGGYPAGRPRLRTSRMRLVHRLKSEGLSNRAIAGRIGVTEKAVRKTLRRLGFEERRPEEPLLPLAPACADPNMSASASVPPEQAAPDAPGPDAGAAPAATPPADPNLSGPADDEPLPVTSDRDPADRGGDRLLAYLGLLDDAAPLFRDGTRVPRAGVLLALPALLATGVLACAREVYGSIGPAFYGLRTSVLALLLLALLRIKRPEALKEHSPADLGRLLGLDRAPEVKTLRRKLARLAAMGGAAAFGRALARRRVADRGAALGLLYVDGHVRVYHGRHAIPKAHVARMRLAAPATTDYWVHDTGGEPLFVVTAEANAGLVRMLPGLLDEIRALIGERRATVVFDRGGWSPKLFLEILARGFDLLTYRKGSFPPVLRRFFRKHRAEIDGRIVRYVLADRGIRLLRGRLRLRQVTRLSDNGHQTPVVTSRRDLGAAEVAHRMFERWRQENFFKYLREEYALDALAEHAVEKDDPRRDVPNPRWNALAAEIRRARSEVDALSSRYGLDAFRNPEQIRRTMRGFKIAHARKARALQGALGRLDALEARRKRVPPRVPVRDVVQGPVVKLAPERQHLTNVLKMVAYQAESELLRAIRPHYRRADQEGRTLVQSALASAGDIEATGTELRVTIAPLSSAHRTKAVAALCEDLNRSPVRFPGSALRLRFAVASPAPDRTDS